MCWIELKTTTASTPGSRGRAGLQDSQGRGFDFQLQLHVDVPLGEILRAIILSMTSPVYLWTTELRNITLVRNRPLPSVLDRLVLCYKADEPEDLLKRYVNTVHLPFSVRWTRRQVRMVCSFTCWCSWSHHSLTPWCRHVRINRKCSKRCPLDSPAVG